MFFHTFSSKHIAQHWLYSVQIHVENALRGKKYHIIDSINTSNCVNLVCINTHNRIHISEPKTSKIENKNVNCDDGDANTNNNNNNTGSSNNNNAQSMTQNKWAQFK